MKIVTFGEIMLRLSKHGAMRLTQGNSFDANYGGSEANVAVSLAMLGDDVEYVTRVPDNAIGEAALMHLREYGVDVHHSVKGGKRLGTYYFEPSAAMRSSRVVYDRDDSAFNTLSFGDINWEQILKETALFHCSGITCATSQDALDTTMDAVHRAFESGVELTCDINYRANLWKYPGANARKALDELMQYSSFIFGDQNEWYVASGLDPIPFKALDRRGESGRNFSCNGVKIFRNNIESVQQQFCPLGLIMNCDIVAIGLEQHLNTIYFADC